jgi:putative restriction endonuclease
MRDRARSLAKRALPALEAAHIHPIAELETHWVRNGLLLRSDIHRLFKVPALLPAADARREAEEFRPHPLRV